MGWFGRSNMADQCVMQALSQHRMVCTNYESVIMSWCVRMYELMQYYIFIWDLVFKLFTITDINFSQNYIFLATRSQLEVGKCKLCR